MSIEATGVLKKPPSTEKARIDWCHWSDRRLSNRRIEVKRLIHFYETQLHLEYSLFKKQVLEYELERINAVTETRRQANNGIKRQMHESEPEVSNAEISAKSGVCATVDAQSKCQASCKDGFEPLDAAADVELGSAPDLASSPSDQR